MTNPLQRFSDSPLMRVLTLGLLILLLQIPVAMISELIDERQYSRAQAVADITGKWGDQQTLIGPRLIVPYHKPGKRGNNHWITEPESGHVVILPDAFHAESRMGTELRARGIYSVPLYLAQVEMSGQFNLAEVRKHYQNKLPLNWEQAYVLVGISDPKGVRSNTFLRWDGVQLALEPGGGSRFPAHAGVHAKLPGSLDANVIPFQLDLQLAGHDTLDIVPIGRQSHIDMQSDWADPSFQGNWLPNQRDVGAEGFEARWDIPYLGRSYPQHWTSKNAVADGVLKRNAVGVTLLYSLDAYGKSERSTKYSLLFIGLTVIGLWLLEVIGGVRLHSVQYAMVGAVISLFYLLLLSLAEHIGFFYAYLAASVMVIASISAYCISVLKHRGRVVSVTIGLTALYAYLFALLQEQEYALLAGSLGLFAVLVGIMYLTRNLDWAGLQARSAFQDKVDEDA